MTVSEKDIVLLDSKSVSRADVLELFRTIASVSSEASIRACNESRARIPATSETIS